MITPQGHRPIPHARSPVAAGLSSAARPRFRGEMMPPVPNDFVELSAITDPPQGYFLPQVPAFFLHGTSTTGESLTRTAHLFSKLAPNQPTYRSYLPEVQYATGIAQTRDGKNLPAYRMALRDLGDFRAQLIAKNLRRLKQELAARKTTEAQNRVIARFFGLGAPADKKIASVLREEVTALLTDEKTSLLTLAETAVNRLRAEAGKLSASPLPEIIDSHWFDTMAKQDGKKPNWDMRKFTPHAVNPRVIDLETIGRIESALLKFENRLARRLSAVVPAGEQKPELRTLAETFARKIAPQGNAVGHSQGGVVLALALISGLEQLEKPDGNPANLAGRFIGLCLPVAAPIGGMANEPSGFRDLINMMPPGPMRKAYVDSLWQAGERIYAAGPEVRDGSALMERINKSFPLLARHGRTMVSLFDEADLRVEAEDALIPISEGNRANCFNFPVKLPSVPVVATPREEYKEFMDKLTHPLVKAWQPLFAFNPMAMWMNEMGYQWYNHFRQKTRQHWAPLVFPNRAFNKTLTENFFRNPQRLMAALSRGNFEPFRKEALKAANNLLAQSVLKEQTPPAQIAALENFIAAHPGFVQAVAQNAQGVSLAGSAAMEADAVLEKLLTIIENAMNHTPNSGFSHKPLMTDALDTIRNASVSETIAQRARHLKTALNALEMDI